MSNRVQWRICPLPKQGLVGVLCFPHSQKLAASASHSWHGYSGHRRNFEAEREQLSQDELYIIYYISLYLYYSYTMNWNTLKLFTWHPWHGSVPLTSEAESNTLSHVEHAPLTSRPPLAQPRSFTPQPQSNLHFQLGLGQGAVRFTKFWSRSGGPQPKFKAGRCNAGARQSLFSRLLLTHRKVRNAAGILNWTWGIWWVIWGKTWSVEMASNALQQHTLS